MSFILQIFLRQRHNDVSQVQIVITQFELLGFDHLRILLKTQYSLRIS